MLNATDEANDGGYARFMGEHRAHAVLAAKAQAECAMRHAKAEAHGECSANIGAASLSVEDTSEIGFESVGENRVGIGGQFVAAEVHSATKIVRHRRQIDFARCAI